MRQQVRGEEMVLSKGFEACLFGYDKNQWEQIAQKQLEDSSVVNINDRDLRRYLFSGAAVVALDAQGRFVIPPALLEYIGVDDGVAIVGAGDHFEIWKPGIWEKKMREIEEKGPGNNADRVLT